MAVDDSDSDVVYVGYQSRAGDYDVYVQRSTDGGSTWDGAVQVNEDPGARHQIFPTIEVSNGALHVGWYDFRNSLTAGNKALDVYYACTNCDGLSYPAFSHNERVTDISHNGNCLTFGGGTSAFHGDYNELDAYWDGDNHVVHVAGPTTGTWFRAMSIRPQGRPRTTPATATRTSTRTNSSCRRRASSGPGTGPSRSRPRAARSRVSHDSGFAGRIPPQRPAE